MYLNASTNNKATTVFQLFITATLQYGLPASVRSDHGGENRHVALFMNLISDARQRHFTGRSVHNQRIERLWRDVHTQVTGWFYDLFYQMEDDGKLDINNENEIKALHLVYLPVINNRFSVFKEGWNNHSIRTEGNQTPEQLWMLGTIENGHQNTSSIRGILSPEASVRNQLQLGLAKYGLTFENFNDMGEIEDQIEDQYIEDLTVQDILARNSNLEDKYLEVKAYLCNN